MSEGTVADQEWARLAELGDAEREPQMQARYIELADVSEAERRSRLKSMAQAEQALPDGKLRSLMVSRLRVWLGMEQETAQRVAGSYDAVMNQMPAAESMRQFTAVQSTARTFSLEEQDRLRVLIPRVLGSQHISAVRTSPSASDDTAAPQRKRGWSFFSKKR